MNIYLISKDGKTWDYKLMFNDSKDAAKFAFLKFRSPVVYIGQLIPAKVKSKSPMPFFKVDQIKPYVTENYYRKLLHEQQVVLIENNQVIFN